MGYRKTRIWIALEQPAHNLGFLKQMGSCGERGSGISFVRNWEGFDDLAEFPTLGHTAHCVHLIHMLGCGNFFPHPFAGAHLAFLMVATEFQRGRTYIMSPRHTTKEI